MAGAFMVTAAAGATAAAIATAVAFWRDTTFQSLAITLFAIAAWLAAGEAVAALRGGELAAAISPIRGLFAALAPDGSGVLGPFLGPCGPLATTPTGWADPVTRAWDPAGPLGPKVGHAAGGPACRARRARRAADCRWHRGAGGTGADPFAGPQRQGCAARSFRRRGQPPTVRQVEPLCLPRFDDDRRQPGAGQTI